ncbi:hypothetical protein KPB2_5370 [Klebsiella pneumoniae Kb677]|nr:hypothetical protein KPB2_5370 [Klebsiella pneumoniae Kb677]
MRCRRARPTHGSRAHCSSGLGTSGTGGRATSTALALGLGTGRQRLGVTRRTGKVCLRPACLLRAEGLLAPTLGEVGPSRGGRSRRCRLQKARGLRSRLGTCRGTASSCRSGGYGLLRTSGFGTRASGRSCLYGAEATTGSNGPLRVAPLPTSVLGSPVFGQANHSTLRSSHTRVR